MRTRSGRQASQQPFELARFIQIIDGACSYLEVGARHGDTFFEVMKSLPYGAKGVAIDLPNGPWGGDSKHSLLEAADHLREMHYDIEVIFGDSREIELPLHFDAVLIDGDHRYEAVKSDFEKFHGDIVALHDIAGHGLTLRDMEIGVPRFWDEIKHNYMHEEIIIPSDDRPMGIGVIWNE